MIVLTYEVRLHVSTKVVCMCDETIVTILMQMQQWMNLPNVIINVTVCLSVVVSLLLIENFWHFKHDLLFTTCILQTSC
jgi:hypothetical protein